MPAFNESLFPTKMDVLLAQESLRQIGGIMLGRKNSVGLEIEGRQVSIPVSVARILIEAIGRTAEGRAVAIMPLDEEVSPQEAAGILHVSRPFAAKLFDRGAIPSRKVGTHRRALVGDVLAYKEREKKARLEVVDELVAEAQRLNMGY